MLTLKLSPATDMWYMRDIKNSPAKMLYSFQAIPRQQSSKQVG